MIHVFIIAEAKVYHNGSLEIARKLFNEVIKQWEEKKPNHNEISSNILLRYRNI